MLVTVPINDPTEKPTKVVLGAVQGGGGASTPISPQLAPTNASSRRKMSFGSKPNDN